MIDETHDPARRSWVAGADGHAEFPIQNLPFGVFCPADGAVAGGAPRGGVAIGDHIFDVGAAGAAGLFSGAARDAAEAVGEPTLNRFFGLGAGPRQALRRQLGALLDASAPARPELLHRAAECAMQLPAAVGDYTDFYAGIHHATNAGALFRPDNPLLPNYKWVPIGYHGRASSLLPSGVAVRRPNGQRNSQPGSPPAFGPSRRLDYELELGVWVGTGNELGSPVPISEAGGHIAGFCLLNDWSARDIQAWEYQPLGPFLAKNFASTLSCWVVTPEALAPFRAPAMTRAEGDPAPLPYLDDAADRAVGGLDVELSVSMRSAAMRAAGLPAQRLSVGNARYLYWSFAQMLAHHTAGGCNLRPGDLLGSGTISAPDPGGYGSLLELSAGGKTQITLPGGETRSFIEDGDEISFAAHARREGFATIGFGACSAVVLPAR